MSDQIVIYQSADGTTGIEVHLEAETVWLTQKQMAELFDKDVRTVNEHIRNIFKEGELAENSVIRKFRITASDGKTYETSHYNLDVIIFVIKDHPFVDGNKRIGSFLFLLYNRQEELPEIISENTLTALALLIAESEPTNKDLMIRLVVNLLIGDEK